MHPILFSIGPLTIRTYGFLVAVGLFVALRYLIVRAKSRDIKENDVLDLVLYAVVAGLVGARIAYIALDWRYFAAHPVEIFKIWEGGLVFYGGFLLGAAAVILFIRQRGLRLWKVADLVAPALALGHVFGRIGCFFAGCCYGIPGRIPWAVSFTDPGSLCQSPLPRHPVQLYEAAGNLVLFIVLDRYDRTTHREGNTFAFYLIFYAALRFMMEFLRGDDRGGFLLGVSPSQWIAVLMAAAGVALLSRRTAKAANP